VINSVGIDVGTTTTQVIFSSLKLMNIAAPTQVPRFEFIERDILYKSEIYLTPFTEEGSIDEKKLWDLILSEYDSAGFDSKIIETGAIIITGETSKAKNAKTTLMKLTSDLGDFVVATAGPHLESVIAGRGSGSSAYSEEHSATVLNIDIGGGTSNFVVFRNGRVIDTCCLNTGGRLIEVESNGKVKRITQPAEKIIRRYFPNFNNNYNELSCENLKLICEQMAECITECMTQGTEVSSVARELLMTPPLKKRYKYDAVFISGGVGECFYDQKAYENKFIFGDIGVLLADALHNNKRFIQEKILRPAQTIRATVIGAGAYTLSLSGSTIWLSVDKLPLRNIPVIHPRYEWNNISTSLSDSIIDAAERMDIDLSSDEYAIYLEKAMPVTYGAVKMSAEELLKVYRKYPSSNNSPAIVLSYNDVGKVLGMELEPKLKPRPFAVIDEVQSYEGDYVDIGKSYFGGEIVPLTIKSLAFP
jgi:ethanolamine utilization protein EutA